jgi:hypothetical protein
MLCKERMARKAAERIALFRGVLATVFPVAALARSVREKRSVLTWDWSGVDDDREADDGKRKAQKKRVKVHCWGFGFGLRGDDGKVALLCTRW